MPDKYLRLSHVKEDILCRLISVKIFETVGDDFFLTDNIKHVVQKYYILNIQSKIYTFYDKKLIYKSCQTEFFLTN